MPTEAVSTSWSVGTGFLFGAVHFVFLERSFEVLWLSLNALTLCLPLAILNGGLSDRCSVNACFNVYPL